MDSSSFSINNNDKITVYTANPPYYEGGDESAESLASLLAQSAQHPSQKGAKGDGITDDTTAIINTNAINGNLLISNGTFRITQNITLNHVFFLKGGCITVDSGVVVTIGSVISDPATVIFKGAGTIVTKNNRYSVGWFDGAYFNNKWDFCRRAWRTEANNGVGIQKYVHVPIPKSDDPACGASIATPYAWKINAPVQIEFDDDNLIFDSEAIFNVVSACAGFEFSPYNAGASNNNKTDEIRFPKGLNVEGGTSLTSAIGTIGILIHGGARIIFDGAVRTKAFTQYGVQIANDVCPSDEVVFNFLEVTSFGQIGLYVNGGLATGNPSLSQFSSGVRYLFTNGALSGATNFCKITGNVNHFKIEKYYEFLNASLFDVSDSAIALQSTSNGYPLHVTLNDLFSQASTKPLVKTSNNGGSTKVTNLTVSKLYSKNASVLVNLAYSSGILIRDIQQGAPTNSIVVGSDCDHVDVECNRSVYVSGNCPQLMINKKYYANNALATSTAVAIPFDNNVNGLVDVVALEDATCCATFLIRNGGAIVNQVIGSNVTTQSGTVLSGTTGTAGKANFSYASGTLYIENQIGSTRTFIVHGITF